MYTSATIFLCIIVFCVGAAIGALIERAQKRRSTPRQPLPNSINKLAKDGDVEVFGAWRTGSNKIWMELDGKRVDNQEALLPEQRQRLLNLVLDLRPWLEMARPASSDTGTAPQPVRQATPEPGVAAQPVQTQNDKNAFAGEANMPAPAFMSIIEQINKVLQAKLATSVFKDRGIRLTEGSGGIVIIKDGTNSYEGIDTVPDPEVKTLIQQAVADWEKGTK